MIHIVLFFFALFSPNSKHNLKNAHLINILHNKALKRIPFCGILSKFALKIQKEPIMKRIFIPFTILLSTVVVFSSCLSSDDNEVTYYDDSGITSFTLGTLNRTMHTLSSKGVDSVYQTTITGSDYQFYIDQDKREIYNPDSLPYGHNQTYGIRKRHSSSSLIFTK